MLTVVVVDVVVICQNAFQQIIFIFRSFGMNSTFLMLTFTQMIHQTMLFQICMHSIMVAIFSIAIH